MGFLKGLGQFTGEVTGKVLGGTVRVVGEVAGSQYIKDIGNGVEKASINTGKTVGQLVSGVFDVAKGAIKQDGSAVDNGFNDIGGAISKTVKGVVESVKYVYDIEKHVVVGIKDDDMDKVKQGAKGLVAAVSVVAVDIIDMVDGADGVGELAADGDVEILMVILLNKQQIMAQ
jgi:phage-related protein